MPDELLFAVLLRAYGKRDPPPWGEVSSLLSKMRNTYGIQPKLVTCAAPRAPPSRCAAPLPHRGCLTSCYAEASRHPHLLPAAPSLPSAFRRAIRSKHCTTARPNAAFLPSLTPRYNTLLEICANNNDYDRGCQARAAPQLAPGLPWLLTATPWVPKGLRCS